MAARLVDPPGKGEEARKLLRFELAESGGVDLVEPVGGLAGALQPTASPGREHGKLRPMVVETEPRLFRQPLRAALHGHFRSPPHQLEAKPESFIDRQSAPVTALAVVRHRGPQDPLDLEEFSRAQPHFGQVPLWQGDRERSVAAAQKARRVPKGAFGAGEIPARQVSEPEVVPGSPGFESPQSAARGEEGARVFDDRRAIGFAERPPDAGFVPVSRDAWIRRFAGSAREMPGGPGTVAAIERRGGTEQVGERPGGGRTRQRKRSGRPIGCGIRFSGERQDAQRHVAGGDPLGRGERTGGERVDGLPRRGKLPEQQAAGAAHPERGGVLPAGEQDLHLLEASLREQRLCLPQRLHAGARRPGAEDWIDETLTHRGRTGGSGMQGALSHDDAAERLARESELGSPEILCRIEDAPDGLVGGHR